MIESISGDYQEKAQIIGLLRICEQAIELPTPKSVLIKIVLNMIRDIGPLAGIAVNIKALIS